MNRARRRVHNHQNYEKRNIKIVITDINKIINGGQSGFNFEITNSEIYDYTAKDIPYDTNIYDLGEVM